MAGPSNFVREAVLNWIRGTAMPAAPTTVYVSLHTADPGLNGTGETSGTGYARIAVTYSAPADDGSDEMISNNAVLTFGPAGSGGWTGPITHFGLWQHLTSTAAANYIWGGTSTNRTVNEGDSYQFATSNLKLKLR